MKCPQCGREMEHGTLQIENEYFAGYGVRWFPKGEKVVHGIGGEIFHPWWLRKPGVMCRECGLILLRWKGLAGTKEPIPDKP